MPTAFSMATRQEIVRRRLDGQQLAQIALEMNLSYHSVRRIWRCFRERGHDGLNPRYRNCARPSTATEVLGKACALKAAHPHWGAPVVRIELARELGLDVGDLPVARTLQRAFRAAGAYPPKRPKKPKAEPAPRATRIHEVWQVDAVEKTRLADGRLASWLTVVEEATGSLLDAELSPPRAVAGDHRRGDAHAVSPGFPPMGPARAASAGQRPSLGLGP